MVALSESVNRIPKSPDEAPEPENPKASHAKPDETAVEPDTTHEKADQVIVPLTLLSTGEVEEIDVTGWRNQSHAEPAGEQPDGAITHNVASYSNQCTAFGLIITYCLVSDESNNIQAETVSISITGTQSAGTYETFTPEDVERI